MAEAVKKLEYHKEIELTPEIKQKLLSISASTIDRLLKPEKDRYRLGKGKWDISAHAIDLEKKYQKTAVEKKVYS